MTKKHIAERHCRATAGFTLVEVMLVVVILAIMASVAMVATRGKTQKASIAATRTSISAVSTALDNFEVDNGVYPNSLRELMSDTGHATWDGPYLKGSALPSDAWGRELQYSKTSSGDYQVLSMGPDGVKGGSDDLLSL